MDGLEFLCECIFVGFVQILNLVMFLRQGQYPTPSLMLLGIKPVSTIEETRSVGYSFMSRYSRV